MITSAVELLKGELQETQVPRRSGHLMIRISTFYGQLGEISEAVRWLKKAGKIFEKSGNVRGLADFQCRLAEIYRSEGRVDEAILAYRKALDILEDRSFYSIGAITRVNLASTLLYRGRYGEAQRLLNDAETICDKHLFTHLIPIIARIRSSIEGEIAVAQAPKETLASLLNSLDQLVKYRPEHALAYLPFWYFTWTTELLALLRSGSQISFVVITDSVEGFISFAEEFRHLGDYFLMATSSECALKIDTQILSIPPDWLFPPSFPFLFIKKNPSKTTGEQTLSPEKEYRPIQFTMEGPAKVLPRYILIDVKSGAEDEGHFMALYGSYLCQEAVDLMINRPIVELIQKRAIWFPTERFKTDDPFLHDLRVARGRGLFPVYFDNLPTSDEAAVCGTVHVSIPDSFFGVTRPPASAKWGRALMKLTMLPKKEAQSALLDLPEIFMNSQDEEDSSHRIEIHLFEFPDMHNRVVYPIILVRTRFVNK